MQRPAVLRALLLGGLAALVVNCDRWSWRETYWISDGGGAGARVYVDGKLLKVLELSKDREGAILAPEYLSPCHDWGDTVVAESEDRVLMTFSMPDDERQVSIVTRDGDSVSVTAYLWDSPHFSLYVRCGVLHYPSVEGYKTARLHRRAESSGSDP